MDTKSLLLLGYATAEVAFYFVYTYYLKPRANVRTEPHEYRDYGCHRHKLLLRILERMERTCRATNQDLRDFLNQFLNQWFHHHGGAPLSSSSSPPALKRMSKSSIYSTSSSPEVSDNEEDDNNNYSHEDWTMGDLKRDDSDTFLAWAFFGKHYQDLNRSEHMELDKIYMILQERYDLVFVKGKCPTKTARLLTLEDVNPLHRPLALYVGIHMLRMSGGILLRLLGFRRHVAKTGLVYWHRGCCAAANTANRRLPLLFFHGIAPGGLVPYLPLVLVGIGISNRDCFLFENRSISCSIGFNALGEQETVAGVLEALVDHADPHCNDVALCGHSFGSCPITWLLHSPLRERIRQIVLLDPVTILLSEPDVMNNFLYSQQIQPPASHTTMEAVTQSIARAKIRLLASSELHTEYYLRRHFSWFNSEIWLDEIPPNVQVAVCLAENDEIVNSQKVQQEVMLHNKLGDATQIKLVYWEGVGHARCITSVPKWREIRNVMMQQESSFLAADKKSM